MLERITTMEIHDDGDGHGPTAAAAAGARAAPLTMRNMRNMRKFGVISIACG
jgi:hypothetical protein